LKGGLSRGISYSIYPCKRSPGMLTAGNFHT